MKLKNSSNIVACLIGVLIGVNCESASDDCVPTSFIVHGTKLTYDKAETICNSYEKHRILGTKGKCRPKLYLGGVGTAVCNRPDHLPDAEVAKVKNLPCTKQYWLKAGENKEGEKECHTGTIREDGANHEVTCDQVYCFICVSCEAKSESSDQSYVIHWPPYVLFVLLIVCLCVLLLLVLYLVYTRGKSGSWDTTQQ